MEILRVHLKLRQGRVLQQHGIAGIGRHEHAVGRVEAVRKQARGIGEDTVVECKHVVVGADGAVGLRHREVGDDVVPEMQLEHEHIRVAPTRQDVVPAAAFQHVLADAAIEGIGIVGAGDVIGSKRCSAALSEAA